MIKNETQYLITQNKLGEFKQAIETLPNSAMNEPFRSVFVDSLKSQVETFEREIEEFERLNPDNEMVKFYGGK
jgi:hypothetical protein